MVQAVRVGVVGAGDFGIRHVAVAAALPEVELVAVADPSPSRAELVNSRWAVPTCRDVRELLREHAPEAVVIATPQSLHLSDLTAAVTAGVHALVEKPIISAGEEADELQRLCAAHPEVVVMPAHVSRFLPSVATLRDRLAGERVTAVRAVRVVPTERLDLHGGEHPALVAMVHDLDIVRAFVSAELRDVTSVQRWTDDARPHPQVVLAHLTFADGTVASVENYWTLPHSRQYIDARLEVTTDRSIGHVTVPGAGLRLVRPAGDEVPDIELEATVAGLPVGALATQLRHFAACVRAGHESPVVTVDDALWAVRVAARIAQQVPAAPPQVG
jgi:predicted dehydrogenase